MLVLVDAVGLIVDVELSIEIGLGVSLLVMLFSPTRIPLGSLGCSETFSVFWMGSASKRIQCTLFFVFRISKARF